MAKPPPLKPPSIESINMVLQAASEALRPVRESRQLEAAMLEVQGFFQVLLKPQASANAGGSASDASQPAGRPERPK